MTNIFTSTTVLFMNSINSIFVANQLRHSLHMLIKRYFKWLHEYRTGKKLRNSAWQVQLKNFEIKITWSENVANM